MIVVSNTSPLTNLAAIGNFQLLREIYGGLHIADAVWQELNAGGHRWPGATEVAAAPWIQRHQVQNTALVAALSQDLDRGESETIAIALELRADLVLMDEREGRHLAQRLGLRVSGVAGVLLAAKQRGLLDEVRTYLDGLRHAGFFLSESVYRAILAQAKEALER